MKRSRTIFIIELLFIATMVKAQVDADIVVALDGTGDYTKMQDAIDAVGSNSNQTTVIYIKRGLYNNEKLMVPDEKKNIALVGESRDETIISYHIYNCPDRKCPAEDAVQWSGNNIATPATLTVRSEGVRAENLTIRNIAGPVGQARAITVQADKVVFANCSLYGYPDTIYLWTTGIRTFFKSCLIVGRTDYIYGSGIGYFLSCEVKSWGGGWITAPAMPGDQDYGFVFYQCDISYAGDSPRKDDDVESIRLGRPWHNYPKVSWLYCDMTEMIHPEGWGDTWNFISSRWQAGKYEIL
jgi:pectinesterase